MSPGLALAIAILLLAANAFFVGAEFAIMSARRDSIEPLAATGARRAVTVLWAMENLSRMLAAAQLGVTVCSTSLGAVAEPAIAHLIEGPLHAAGVDEAWTHPISFVVALGLVVYLHVVVGEMVPKNLALAGPDRAVLALGPVLVVFARAVGPVVGGLNWVANLALHVLRVQPRDEVLSAFTAEEVQSIVERSQAEGLLDDTHGLISGALEFSDHTAADVMIDAAAVVSLEPGATPADVEHLVAHTGFSRFAVVDDSGSPIGYLHVKDVLYADASSRHQPVQPWRTRQLAVVDCDDEVETVLAVMQRSGAHLARVEQAGTYRGIIFLEDILEELVGEVYDAFTAGEPGRRRLARSRRPLGTDSV